MSRQYVHGAAATVRMRRSRFILDHELKTSMNVGELVPIDVQEVLPGDTFKMRETHVMRLSTAFLKVPMDNVYMDTYYFFVPNRLVYDKWENVMGQNDEGAWANENPPDVPVIGDGEKIIIAPGTVGDYMGLPVGKEIPGGINVMPFRAFALIYDEWFRNENTVLPMHVQKGEIAASEMFNENAWAPGNYMGKLPKVGKRKDYFTSCLPAPQKGDGVDLSVGIVEGQYAPVRARAESAAGGPFIATRLVDNNNDKYINGSISIQNNGELVMYGSPSGATNSPRKIAFENLWADISDTTISPISVNDMRMAFQMQKMLEKDARYGTRYREYILGHFGVSNPDARMQIPEFLGGSRTPIRMQQVTQTNTQQKDAEQTIESPLASLGAMSHSVGRSRYVKSFTEHGFVIAVACIRQFHTYQQGVDKFWTRKTRNDYYDPLFANLGEQPVYQSELYADAGTQDTLKGQVFGYNEAWADYRYKPSKITGEMRSGIENSQDVWHFGDYYSNGPVLGQEFTDETGKFFDRTVAAPSTSQDNFIVDFHFETSAYRIMPVYSTPGLIDHH